MKVDRERTCWSSPYVLAHCEGYRVESSEGTLGYVEEVVSGRRGCSPALRVRTCAAKPGLATLALEDVLEVNPHLELIVTTGGSR